MISNTAIAGLALSFVLSTATPFLLFFLLRKRMTLSTANVGVGALAFFVSALVLEQLPHYLVLKASPGATAWFHANRWAYVTYAVLAAGVFEEVGRYIAMRRFVKPTGNPGTAVAYGLGHGGVEAVLLGGLVQLQSVVIAILFNTGVLDPASPLLPGAYAQVMHLTLPLALIGGVERVIALGFQITISFVVWRAVDHRAPWLLVAAIVFHAFGDLGAGLYQAGAIHSIYLAEVWAVVVIVLVAGFLWVLRANRPPGSFAPANLAR